MHRARRSSVVLVAIVTAGIIGAGCGILGSAEITLRARNESDLPMEIGVIRGFGDEEELVSEAVFIAPGTESDLTLNVPGGDWTIVVNGARLLSTSDTQGRVGVLPVMLVLPAADDPIGRPYWEAPSGWADGGP